MRRAFLVMRCFKMSSIGQVPQHHQRCRQHPQIRSGASLAGGAAGGNRVQLCNCQPHAKPYDPLLQVQQQAVQRRIAEALKTQTRSANSHEIWAGSQQSAPRACSYFWDFTQLSPTCQSQQMLVICTVCCCKIRWKKNECVVLDTAMCRLLWS